MQTTLNLLRPYRPCVPGAQAVLAALGKDRPDDEPFSLEVILDAWGVSGALWATRGLITDPANDAKVKQLGLQMCALAGTPMQQELALVYSGAMSLAGFMVMADQLLYTNERLCVVAAANLDLEQCFVAMHAILQYSPEAESQIAQLIRQLC